MSTTHIPGDSLAVESRGDLATIESGKESESSDTEKRIASADGRSIRNAGGGRERKKGLQRMQEKEMTSYTIDEGHGVQRVRVEIVAADEL